MVRCHSMPETADSVELDGRFRGTVRIRQALQLSLNIPVVKLTEAFGPSRLMTHLRRAGVEARLPGGKGSV